MANDNKLVNLADLKEAFDVKFDNANVYNGVDQTSEGYALDARQGKTLNDAKLDKNFSQFPTAVTPYANTDLVPLYRNGTVYSTDMQTLINSAGGGGGTQQGALSNYVATYSFIAANTTHTFADSNLTAQMAILEAYAPDGVSVSLKPNITDGSITFTGTVSADCSIVFYFGVGLAAAPLLLVNLGSNDADNLLKAAPRPGVYNVLGLSNGGTGVNATDNADLLDKMGVTDAIAQSMAIETSSIELSANVQSAAINQIRKSGKVVSFNYEPHSSSRFTVQGKTFLLGTIPASFRPANNVNIVGIALDGLDYYPSGFFNVTIRPNGEIVALNHVEGDINYTLCISASYVVD